MMHSLRASTSSFTMKVPVPELAKLLADNRRKEARPRLGEAGDDERPPRPHDDDDDWQHIESGDGGGPPHTGGVGADIASVAGPRTRRSRGDPCRKQ